MDFSGLFIKQTLFQTSPSITDEGLPNPFNRKLELFARRLPEDK